MQKKYAGQCKITEGKYGPEADILLFPDDLKAIGDKWREIKDQPKAAIRLKAWPKKEPKSDWTHYVFIDEPREQSDAEAAANVGSDNMPF